MRNRSNVLPLFEPTWLAPALAVGACLLVATPSLAQQARPGEVMGLRYLTWAGKPDAPTAGAADGLRRSNAAGPPTLLSANGARYPGIQTASARPSRYGVGSGGGLTPASAWTGSGRTPAPAPVPLAAAPAPVAEAPISRGPIPVYSAPQQAQVDPAEQARAQAAYQAQIQSQYQAWYQSEAQAQYEAQVRAMPQPEQQAVRVQAPAVDQTQQPAPLQQRADASAAAAASPGYDPMAPRRDAPIFRMQQPQAETQPQQQTASTQTNGQGEVESPVLTQPVAGRTTGGQAYAGAEPPREGVRYYSVQRAVGRQPDPIAMPESVYLDNAPIDLAEPPAAPVRTRTVNGQAQVVVPNQDPNLP